MQITSAVVVAAAGLALLATSSPMGGQTPEAPSPVPRAVGTGSEDLAAGPDKGPSGTERVAITTRPIPLPPAAALAPASPSDLDRGGVLVAAYNAAVAAAPPECHLPPALLAAIGQIESGSAGGRQIGPDHKVNPPIYGPVLDGGPFAAIRDTDGGLFDGDIVWDRAVGPMQFIPGTWRLAGVDGDADGLADPQNVYDAAFGAAGYLCRANRDMNNPDDLRAAIFSYNHSDAYVAGVLEWLDYFGARGLGTVSQVSFLVASGGRASQMQSPGAGAGSVNAIEATVPALTRPPTTTPTTTPGTTPGTTTTTTPRTTPGTTTTTTPGTTPGTTTTTTPGTTTTTTPPTTTTTPPTTT
ncbi:MAG TPA: lytic transglycosylase domain-containing protein, partial [Pedococcus sp.]|nr:lytic transglycosylase domain-containing protein [Pedococcus sp.]